MLVVRRLLAILLLLCGLVAVAVGVPAAWAKDSLLDTEHYTEAVAPLIAEPAVQATVTDALVAAVEDRLSVPGPLTMPLRRAVSGVVASDAFATVWETAVRASHEQALAALRDEGRGLALDEGTLSVEIAPLVASLAPRLEAAGIPGTSALRHIDGSIELVSSPELATAARAASLVDRWGAGVLLAGAMLLLASLLVSDRRAGALLAAGLGVLAVSAVHLVILRRLTVAGEDESNATQAARLVVTALGDGLQGMVLTAAVAGAAAAAVGVGVVLVSRRTGH